MLLLNCASRQILRHKSHKPLGSNRIVCVLYIKLLLVNLSTFLKSTTVRIKEHICCMFLYELTSWIHFFLETLECFFLGKVLLQLTVTNFHSTKPVFLRNTQVVCGVLPDGIVLVKTNQPIQMQSNQS